MTVVELTDDFSNSAEAWNRRASEHISEAAACCWTETGMRVRHERIAQILASRAREGDTVYDHGCGTGHLRDALLDVLRKGVAYVGWDRSPGMRERARRQRPGIDVRDQPPAEADHVVACGVYNLSDGWDQGKTSVNVHNLWERYRPRTLVVTFRTGEPAEGHLSYSSLWIASLADALTRSWAYDGTTLPHEAFLVLDGGGRK